MCDFPQGMCKSAHLEGAFRNIFWQDLCRPSGGRRERKHFLRPFVRAPGIVLGVRRVRSSIRSARTNGLLSERLSLARRFVVSRSLLSNVPTHPQDCRFFRGLPLKMSTKSEIRFLPLPRVYDGLFRVSVRAEGKTFVSRRSGRSCKTFLFAENTRDVRSSLVLQREIRENSGLVD